MCLQFQVLIYLSLAASHNPITVQLKGQQNVPVSFSILNHACIM